MKTSPRFRNSIAALLMCAAFPASGSAPADPAAAATFLSFETRIDGRCHNLSEGGKLAVMHNKHPTKAIEFRLIRYHVDVPQWGRTTGIAPAGEPPVKLGCTLVGGREQRWAIERARFTKETTQ
tara:strand:- start:1239 stop:1610 length:372 start_codon:yes stop_codon:yes gene_type:complete